MPKWAKLTNNTILDCAAHYHIDFIDNVHPFQHTVPNQISFSETEQRVIDAEVSKLLEKGVIEPCVPETGEFISTVFLRPKKDGSHRMILNLNKTPAKAFTPPAENKKGHKVVFRQKSKRVTGLYLKAPKPHSFAMESVKICHFETFRVGHFALRTFCCFFLQYINVKKFGFENISAEYEFKLVKFKEGIVTIMMIYGWLAPTIKSMTKT